MFKLFKSNLITLILLISFNTVQSMDFDDTTDSSVSTQLNDDTIVREFSNGTKVFYFPNNTTRVEFPDGRIINNGSKHPNYPCQVEYKVKQ